MISILSVIMTCQESKETDYSRRTNVGVRVLSLVDVVAVAVFLLLIFVFPTYDLAGEALSSQTGTVIQSTSSATIFEANPQAFAVVMGIVALTLVTLVLTLLTAWLDWSPARWTLLALLVPLTGLALLAVFSIGVFMAPLVTIGWVVFAMRRRRTSGYTGA
jgi:hypothetical protein